MLTLCAHCMHTALALNVLSLVPHSEWGPHHDKLSVKASTVQLHMHVHMNTCTWTQTCMLATWFMMLQECEGFMEMEKNQQHILNTEVGAHLMALEKQLKVSHTQFEFLGYIRWNAAEERGTWDIMHNFVLAISSACTTEGQIMCGACKSGWWTQQVNMQLCFHV